MGTTAEAAAKGTPAERFGLASGDIVQEFGYDDDVDYELREAIEAIIGEELLDEDAQEVVDAVLLWWRADDGDLVDGLVDVIGTLSDTGVIWLMTPKRGEPEYVDMSDIEEAVPTAGLNSTSSMTCGRWFATRLVQRG